MNCFINFASRINYILKGIQIIHPPIEILNYILWSVVKCKKKIQRKLVILDNRLKFDQTLDFFQFFIKVALRSAKLRILPRRQRRTQVFSPF